MTDDVVDLYDREEAVYRARLSGKSPRKIAHEFRLSIQVVQDIIEKQSPTIDNRLRLATIGLDLDRLDALQEVFHQKATEGDVQAAAVVLKVQERRSPSAGVCTIHNLLKLAHRRTPSARRRSGRGRPVGFHIPDDGLPSIINVDVLDANVLMPTVTQASKNFNLRRIGLSSRAAAEPSAATRRSLP